MKLVLIRSSEIWFRRTSPTNEIRVDRKCIYAFLKKSGLIAFLDLFQGCDAKRPKLSSSSCSSLTPGVSTPSADVRVRKSTRHRRVRGEKELNVSSKLTLLELKVMVSYCFSVMHSAGKLDASSLQKL
jgi:hypothetical protein